MNGHHIWCNGNPNTPVETCKWCSGPDGFLAKYPMDCTPEELVRKHFPSVVERSHKNEETIQDIFKLGKSFKKFLELAPDSSKAETAKQMLKYLEKEVESAKLCS